MNQELTEEQNQNMREHYGGLLLTDQMFLDDDDSQPDQGKLKSNQDTSIPHDEHPFSTIFGSIRTYDRAGQTFVTSTNRPMPLQNDPPKPESQGRKVVPMTPEEREALHQKIIRDIMINRKCSREEAEMHYQNPF